MAEPQYYIREGVRRAVAARETGVSVLSAWLEVEGRRDQIIEVSLDQLHSPREAVSITEQRYLNVLRGMRTPLDRKKLPLIVVEPLGTRRQTGSVPLAQVRLEP